MGSIEHLNLPKKSMYSISNKIFCLENCKDHKKGLAGVTELESYNGMIFNFQNPGSRTFHMAGCVIPLDIIFSRDRKIIKIFHDCLPCNDEPCKKYTCESADSIIELSGGSCNDYNISEGMVYKLI
jgi:uncharacterized membrane protein (UPF0127 family)